MVMVGLCYHFFAGMELGVDVLTFGKKVVNWGNVCMYVCMYSCMGVCVFVNVDRSGGYQKYIGIPTSDFCPNVLAALV